MEDGETSAFAADGRLTMGLAIPRPAMRKRERRNIEARLARHSELMREFEAQGMDHAAASEAAMHALLAEESQDAAS